MALDASARIDDLEAEVAKLRVSVDDLVKITNMLQNQIGALNRDMSRANAFTQPLGPRHVEPVEVSLPRWFLDLPSKSG